ncbi:MAG: hypothetical protein K940chlam3_01048 [Chlamydiae bacterium]|nr:hypothetical protein [Chlamydiota bacterium]
MFQVRLFFSLMFIPLALVGQNYIQSPNGNQYEIEMKDPVVHDSSDHVEIRNFFQRNGYVVVDNVSEKKDRDGLVAFIDKIMNRKSSSTRRLGFLDLYHDDQLAQLRQNPKLYGVFTSIFGTEKLWVVFDRVIHQLVDEYESPLNPHVDQNPVVHPHFFNVQAMLALRDMNEGTGTLALVPRSHQFFHEYKEWSDSHVGFVEHCGKRKLSFIGVRLKEGQLVIWDSRTTHCRFRGSPLSNRYAALLTFTKAENNQELIDLRLKAFKEGVGVNHHQAGLRATAKPRLEISLRETQEDLTPLGRKLYGLENWFVSE